MFSSVRRRAIIHAATLTALGVIGSACAKLGVRQPSDTASTLTPPSPTDQPQPSVVPASTGAVSSPTAISTPSTATPVVTDTPIPTTSPATATPAAFATPTPRRTVDSTVAPAPASRPTFSNVRSRTPRDGIQFLQGELPGYPRTSAASVFGFSASDILETMDTNVVDAVSSKSGAKALAKVYDTIAGAVLGTLRDIYGAQWVLVALDAGHGGDKAEFWDSGANGTEAIHTRAVVDRIVALAKGPEYSRLIISPIFNDEIPDNFGIPGKENEPLVNQTVMRQIRAAMLAVEATQWNANHPAAADQVKVHELSIHFNSGVGGAMVLHQGDTVPDQFAESSLEYGQRYLQVAVPALNATKVLPSPLKLWGGNGLHDDIMMYVPGGQITDDAGNPVVLRYGMLQGGGFATVYVQKILKYA